MNNTDISTLMKLLGQMDKHQLSQGLNKINQFLTPEEKRKIIEALNSKNK